MNTIEELNEFEEMDIEAVLGDRASDYYEYIKSPQWQMKAEKIKTERGYRCQLCNVSGYTRTLHVHHNNYYHLGTELDTDLVVLCADCHEAFHKSGIGYNRQVKISREEFLLVLKKAGVTYTNDNPYRYYELGKAIIRHINPDYDHVLYDYYNKVNSEVLYAAIKNCDRRSFEGARDSEDWDGYETEYEWRSSHDYWDEWGKE